MFSVYNYCYQLEISENRVYLKETLCVLSCLYVTPEYLIKFIRTVSIVIEN